MEKETPYYDQFKRGFRAVQDAHQNVNDPAELYAQYFERFINRLLEEKKTNAKK